MQVPRRPPAPCPSRPPPAAPIARTLGVSAGSDSADLGAKINPLNSPVTYRFEWGPTGSYGGQAPAIPEALSRADNVFHFVTAPLAELTPGETYHYRVIATNTQTGEESEGADRTFTTLPAPCHRPRARITTLGSAPRLHCPTAGPMNTSHLASMALLPRRGGRKCPLKVSAPTEARSHSSVAARPKKRKEARPSPTRSWRSGARRAG